MELPASPTPTAPTPAATAKRPVLQALWTDVVLWQCLCGVSAGFLISGLVGRPGHALEILESVLFALVGAVWIVLIPVSAFRLWRIFRRERGCDAPRALSLASMTLAASLGLGIIAELAVLRLAGALFRTTGLA